MLAPKCSTYNGRPTFANPRYLKKAQSEKPYLYEIPYDTSDLANRFAPNREETMTLANESRSKLNKDYVKPYDYTKHNSLYEIFKAPSLEYLYQNNPKHVSFQSPKEFVGSNDMVHNYYLEKAKKSAQLQKDKDVNGKPSMIDPARLPNTANGCKPKPRNWQESMSSRVSNKDVHLGEHRKQKPFLKFNDLQCPTCKKCLYSANHDECRLKNTSQVVRPPGKLFNSCTSKVESDSTHGLNVDIHHIHQSKQNTGCLVPQGQKASDYDNSDPVPPRQNVVPTVEKTDSSQQGLEFLFQSFT
ncbi:hypothetical protein Tco_0198989 [Tanacetum coccineum]